MPVITKDTGIIEAVQKYPQNHRNFSGLWSRLYRLHGRSF